MGDVIQFPVYRRSTVVPRPRVPPIPRTPIDMDDIGAIAATAAQANALARYAGLPAGYAVPVIRGGAHTSLSGPEISAILSDLLTERDGLLARAWSRRTPARLLHAIERHIRFARW